LTQLVRRAEKGDEIILTRRGHSSVRLVPVKAPLDPKSRRGYSVRHGRAAPPRQQPDRAPPAVRISSTEMTGSALMAITFDEPQADACIAALETEDEILISAGTLAEALIVSARRNVEAEIGSIIEQLGFQIVAVTPASARRIADAYPRWGRGQHPAALNFGDSSPTRWAKEHACGLLFVGDDFAKNRYRGRPLIFDHHRTAVAEQRHARG